MSKREVIIAVVTVLVIVGLVLCISNHLNSRPWHDRGEVISARFVHAGAGCGDGLEVTTKTGVVFLEHHREAQIGKIMWIRQGMNTVEVKWLNPGEKP